MTSLAQIHAATIRNTEAQRLDVELALALGDAGPLGIYKRAEEALALWRSALKAVGA